MKMIGRTGLGLLILVFFFICLTNSVHAAEQVCFNTTVTRVGISPASGTNTGYRFEVEGGTCGIPKDTPFFISTALGDAGLATLLTAFSLDKPITMRVDPTIPDSTVATIHVDK